MTTDRALAAARALTHRYSLRGPGLDGMDALETDTELARIIDVAARIPELEREVAWFRAENALLRKALIDAINIFSDLPIDQDERVAFDRLRAALAPGPGEEI